jgi:hypothetical protein
MNLLLTRLDEAATALVPGGGVRVHGVGADRQLMEITGIDEKTIRRGRVELANSDGTHLVG